MAAKPNITYNSLTGDVLLLVPLPGDVHKINYFTKVKQIGYRSQKLIFGAKKVQLDVMFDYEYIGLYKCNDKILISDIPQTSISMELSHILSVFKDRCYAVLKFKKCKHNTIISSDGCDECLDCGERNY